MGFPTKMVILGCFGGTTILGNTRVVSMLENLQFFFFQELRSRVAELEAQLVNLGVWILGETRP